MKILVTGANGFIGKNLVRTLKERDYEVYEYDLGNDSLNTFTKDCEFVFHLAGVNRPEDNDFSDNYTSLEKVLNSLRKNTNLCPVMLSSSIQTELDNEYGKSKLRAEELLKNYEGKYYIYRFPNIYGRGCKPNYNSVIATWCYNLSHNLPITINDRNRELTLLYIDDLVNELCDLLKTSKQGILKTTIITLGELLNELQMIDECIKADITGDNLTEFQKVLKSTYLYYLDDICIKKVIHADNRGSFTELYKSNAAGQVSVNIIRPGIIKGNHYHHNKFEQFTVVYGKCLIVEQNIYTNEVKEIEVSGDDIYNIYMLPG